MFGAWLVRDVPGRSKSAAWCSKQEAEKSVVSIGYACLNCLTILCSFSVGSIENYLLSHLTSKYPSKPTLLRGA